MPPTIKTDDPQHFAFFKASMEGSDMTHGGSDEMLKGFAAAQATWDATMGYNAVKALEAVNDPQGHHGRAGRLGARRVRRRASRTQAREWFKGGIASIIPVPIVTGGRSRRAEGARVLRRLRVGPAGGVRDPVPEAGHLDPHRRWRRAARGHHGRAASRWPTRPASR